MKTKFSFIIHIGCCLTGLLLSTMPMAMRASSTNSLADALNATNLVWVSFPTNQNPAWFPEDAVTHDGDAAVQTGAAGYPTGRFSYLTTTVVGPGNLNFWRKVSSATNSGLLTLRIDNSSFPGGTISGEVHWQQVTTPISSGTHSVQWQFERVNGSSSGADAGWVDEVTYAPLLAVNIDPLTQTAAVGSNASFFAVTLSYSKPIYYQWRHNNTNLWHETNQTLQLSNVGRKDRGIYAVYATNSDGHVAVTNAALYVPIAQQLINSTPLPGGGLQLTWSDGDNAPLTPADLSRFTGLATTNLTGTNVWIFLPAGSLSLSGGNIILTDPNASKYPLRYYRLQEHY